MRPDCDHKFLHAGGSVNGVMMAMSLSGTGEAGQVTQPAERSQYGVGPARQSAVALLLLLALPFTFGAVHMLARRAVDGLWFEAPGLVLVALGLIVATVLLAVDLVHALRARVTFGKTSFSFTLPRHGGPNPSLLYTSADIPYHAIRSIELRREVYGGKLVPVLLRGLVLRTKDNREFVLGHTLEGFEDPGLPFPQIGERLAARCALPFLDQRTIWRRTRKERAAGYISEFDTKSYILDPADIERLNKAHRQLILGIASAFAALVMLGLLADLAA